MGAPEALPRLPLADLPVNVWFVGQESLARQRQGRYLTAAVQGHSGKMRPALARRLIETFSRPGDWVLDPMSGIGTTGVEAIPLGRHYVGIELETRFVRWQRQNLKRARAQGATGRFAVLKADARRLDRAFRPEPLRPGTPPGAALPAPVATVMVSPPYGCRLDQDRGESPSPFVQAMLKQRPRWSGLVPAPYGVDPDNLGNFGQEAQLAALRHVYAGCFQVLRPGGLLVIVLQPNRSQALLQPLHHETARLCQALGFEFLDEIVAVLARVVAPAGEAARLVSHASFWRRLATARQRQAGLPVTLNQLEYILVFRKPEDAAPPLMTKAASRPPLPAPVLAQAVTVSHG